MEMDQAIIDATDRIKRDKANMALLRMLIIATAIVLCTVIICATLLGIYAIRKQQDTLIEQQYALNMQYASLMEYVSGAEITTETIDGSDGGVAAKIEGDNNSISAGDSE